MSSEQSQAVQMSAMLGTLRRSDARQVWKHEAHDFTPWLLGHADLLADALGIEIELAEREVGVGAFSVDLVGRVVGSDQTVIVENQLAPTDHGHLGQLLTYAAGLEAAYIVWITPEFRDEHRRALDWLNEVTREGVSFFGIVLELIQIVDAQGVTSPPAPQLRLVAQPNDWQKLTRATVDGPSGAGNVSSRQVAYQVFFTDVVERLRQKQPDATRVRRVSHENYINLRSEQPGVTYALTFRSDGRFGMELFIDVEGSTPRTKQVFDALLADREAIEQAIGTALTWERQDSIRSSRVGIYREGWIGDAQPVLDDLATFAVDSYLTFRIVFGPRLQRIATAMRDGTPSTADS